MNLGVLWHSMEFPINKILLLSIEIIFCCWNHWNQYFMWHIYSSIYCLIKFIYLAVPPIAVIITALTWYLEIDLSYWFQMWQPQATSKISAPLHCLHNAWYIHVIALNNCRIAGSECGRFYFLIKLQAIQTFFPEIFWKFSGQLFFRTSLKRSSMKACNFIKKRLQHRYFSVNVDKLLRTPILENSC